MLLIDGGWGMSSALHLKSRNVYGVMTALRLNAGDQAGHRSDSCSAHRRGREGHVEASRSSCL